MNGQSKIVCLIMTNEARGCVQRHNIIVSAGGDREAVDRLEVNWRKADRPEKGQDARVLSWRRRFILTRGGPR